MRSICGSSFSRTSPSSFKVNVDEEPAVAQRFQVRSIPTLLVLKGGQEMERIVGVQPKTEIVRRLQRVTG